MMLVRSLALIAIALGIWLASRDAAFGPFVVLIAVGGVIGGLVMIVVNRRPHQPPLTVPDAFARNQPEGILNVSRIRVAGLGGLGMVAVAAAMALTIPAIGVSLGLGLVGGFLIAVALIPYRRSHFGQRT